MSLSVRYAKREELERVNELRRMINELHAENRPDIFLPGFCEELQQHMDGAHAGRFLKFLQDNIADLRLEKNKQNSKTE